jgi:FMN reductase (NADPH)
MATTSPVIESMLQRKSIRRYTADMPPDDLIETVVRAGQQAPFASQLYSVLLSRKQDRNPFGAPLLFTLCVDLHKLQLFMAKRGWQVVTNDLSLLLFGIQDAALMAENMVVAAESLGLGSCFLGMAPDHAEAIAREYRLPQRVFPLVQLTMGYPAEDPPPRPRYPLDFVLFEDQYPDIDEETLARAMAQMDEGYLAHDYYRRGNIRVPLDDERPETYTFDTYSWTEHISRKWGQWHASPQGLLEQFAARGFHLTGATEAEG